MRSWTRSPCRLSARICPQFAPLPVYPAAPRDIAIIVNESIRAAELLKRVKELAGGLAETVSIFDVYSGKQVGEGKRSIGISITYRAPERSLSSEEIDKRSRTSSPRSKTSTTQK